MKINIKEVLFWIFLILAMILLIWNVFGGSPSEFIAITAIIFMLVLKIWSISDRQIKLESNVKYSFGKIKENLNLIKKKLNI